MRWRWSILLEAMTALALLGTIAALAVPGYTLSPARARRAEMRNSLSKLRAYFVTQYGVQGIYGVEVSAAVNPPAGDPPPAPAQWDPHAPGWEHVPSLEGALPTRYWYGISEGGKQLILLAHGNFPGVGAYVYSETFLEGALVLRTEVPTF